MSERPEPNPRNLTQERWLMLFHQLPTKPDYLRVMVGRRLRQMGALALKNTVYVMPVSGLHRNGLEALVREIVERGGEATVAQSRLLTGLTDANLEDRFRRARDTEYGRIASVARGVAAALRARKPLADARRRALGRQLDRLKTGLAEIAARDWFAAGGKETAAGLVSLAEDLLQGVEVTASTSPGPQRPPRAGTWVTRTGVMVDRIASAWLIRRFIDPQARFRFAPGHGYKPRPGDIRFDMAGAEFTHERGLCSFEVLLERFQLRDSALSALGEMVHDLDLEDARHQRPETSGLGRMIVGIALASADDEVRLANGATVLDGLYESFRSTVPSGGPRAAGTQPRRKQP